MKVYFIPCLVFLLFFVSCQNKSSVTPLVEPTIDSAIHIKLPVTVYPYTDTFVGLLSNGVTGCCSYKDSFCTFCVQHMTKDSMLFYNPKSIKQDPFIYDSLTLSYTVRINNSQTYTYINKYNRDKVYVFSLANDSLNVNWDFYTDCSDYKYFGNFTGKKK